MAQHCPAWPKKSIKLDLVRIMIQNQHPPGSYNIKLFTAVEKRFHCQTHLIFDGKARAYLTGANYRTALYGKLLAVLASIRLGRKPNTLTYQLLFYRTVAGVFWNGWSLPTKVFISNHFSTFQSFCLHQRFALGKSYKAFPLVIYADNKLARFTPMDRPDLGPML